MSTEVVTDPSFRSHLVTPASPKEVFEALRRAWSTTVGGTPTTESLLVLLAQWGIETGDGRALHNWNLGNAKRVQGQPWTMLPHVWEILGGHKVYFEPPHPQTHFKAFGSLDEGAVAYLQMMHKRFAASWPQVVAGDPAGFAHALKGQHYYTANEVAYAAALKARYAKFEGEVAPLDVAAALDALGFETVRGFQKSAGLAVDGVVGPKTRAALRRALAEGS
jgi:peptidoglycan hydrolase-like protein with peptidoglycan-binding domain